MFGLRSLDYCQEEFYEEHNIINRICLLAMKNAKFDH